jgi:uncharacterized membrane protein
MNLNSAKRIRTLVFALLAVGAAGAAGCSSDDDGGGAPTIDCSAVASVPTFAQVSVFTSTCNSCHSSTKTGADRKNAPVDINFDDYASAKAHANTAQSEVAGGDMPPATYTGPKPTEAQKTELYTWAQCETPQ